MSIKNNIFFNVTCENQQMADERIPILENNAKCVVAA